MGGRGVPLARSGLEAHAFDVEFDNPIKLPAPEFRRLNDPETRRSLIDALGSVAGVTAMVMLRRSRFRQATRSIADNPL
jgi:hypothetical protein